MLKIKKTNQESRSRAHFLLVQLSVVAMLFLFVFKKELVIVVKDFIQNLPIGSNFVEAIAVKGYVIFTAMSNSPSLFAFCFFILQIFIFTTSFKVIALFFAKPQLHEEDKLTFAKHTKTNTYEPNHRECYLENLRLLF